MEANFGTCGSQKISKQLKNQRSGTQPPTRYTNTTQQVMLNADHGMHPTKQTSTMKQVVKIGSNRGTTRNQLLDEIQTTSNRLKHQTQTG